MALRINQSGTYRNTTSLCVNQSGTYRTIVDGCINQSGTYRCFGMTAATSSLSVSPSSYVEGNSATLSWSSTRATCVVSTTNFSTGATSGSTSVNPASTTTYSITFGNAFANSGAASATLTVTAPALGASYCGGFLICKPGGTRWVVAPSSSEVCRAAQDYNDAATRAQQVSGVGGWFVPTCAELSDPGYCCRVYWDSYTTTQQDFYWASNAWPQATACYGHFRNGNFLTTLCAHIAMPIRAFRTISY